MSIVVLLVVSQCPVSTPAGLYSTRRALSSCPTRLGTFHPSTNVSTPCVCVYMCLCVHVPVCACACVCMGLCSPLPGNQILISKYLARKGVVVSGGQSNGSGWQNSCSPRHWGHSMHLGLQLLCVYMGLCVRGPVCACACVCIRAKNRNHGV